MCSDVCDKYFLTLKATLLGSQGVLQRVFGYKEAV